VIFTISLCFFSEIRFCAIQTVTWGFLFFPTIRYKHRPTYGEPTRGLIIIWSVYKIVIHAWKFFEVLSIVGNL
jgi:hypothetical protein